MMIKDKVAVVTGGGSGIGEGLAERFARDGAKHVVVVDLNESNAQRVAEKIGGTGVGLDVSNEDGIRDLVAQTEANHGSLDVFVSNAGYVTVGGLEAPNEDLQKMWEVHVLAHLYAARAALPGMIRRKQGWLLNTASAAGLLTQIGSLHYSVTKHAAISLAEWLAMTHHHQGIRVSVLCPQAVETNILQNSPTRSTSGERPGVASGDGVVSKEDVADCVMQAFEDGRFWVLPHAEVEEYARRKGADVDRWLAGMRRFQDRLFEGQVLPGEWFLK